MEAESLRYLKFIPQGWLASSQLHGWENVNESRGHFCITSSASENNEPILWQDVATERTVKLVEGIDGSPIGLRTIDGALQSHSSLRLLRLAWKKTIHALGIMLCASSRKRLVIALTCQLVTEWCPHRKFLIIRVSTVHRGFWLEKSRGLCNRFDCMGEEGGKSCLTVVGSIAETICRSLNSNGCSITGAIEYWRIPAVSYP